jgi:tight adherence protein C
MLILIALLIFVALAAGVSLTRRGSRLKELGAQMPYRQAEVVQAVLPPGMGRSLWERVGAGQVAAVTALVGRLAPAATLQRTQMRLDQAGRPHGLTPAGYLALQGLAALVALGAVVALARTGHVPQRLVVVLLLGAPIMATMVPNSLVDQAAEARRKAIRAVLPDAIDILVVSVEAGLSLDGSVGEFVNRDDSPLAEELARAQAEIAAGRSREVAWRDMAARSGVSELATFVSAVPRFARGSGWGPASPTSCIPTPSPCGSGGACTRGNWRPRSR